MFRRRNFANATLSVMLSVILLVFNLSGCAMQASTDQNIISTTNMTTIMEEEEPASASVPLGYTLSRMVILSRHNVRSPLSGSGSTLEKMTTHQWIDWFAPTGELTLRGVLQSKIPRISSLKWIVLPYHCNLL